VTVLMPPLVLQADREGSNPRIIHKAILCEAMGALALVKLPQKIFPDFLVTMMHEKYKFFLQLDLPHLFRCK
jgi:hypothetical protein